MMKIGEIPSGEGNKSFDLFTGPINYEVIAVNPNLKELGDAGIGWIKDEPNYIKDFANGKVVEIAIWLKALSEDQNSQIVPLKFLISFDDFVSQKGNKQFIDKTGRTTWATDLSLVTESDWFTNIGSRPAKRGEELFYRFFNRWVNLNASNGTTDEVLMDIDKMMTGDFTELKDALYKVVVPKQEELGGKYSICVLTGVSIRTNDAGRQFNNLAAYNKQFYNSDWSTDYVGGKFQAYVEGDDYNSFGTDSNPVVYTYTIEKFDPNNIAPDSDPVTDAPKVNDLPF